MSKDIGITIDFGTFTVATDAAVRNAKEGAKNGVERATEHLFRKAEELAPLKKGTLRASERMGISEDGGTISGEVTFGVTEVDEKGNRFNYALKLHEMGEFKNPTTPGTHPKFLERPLKENVDDFKRMIAEEIRKGLM